MPTRRSRYVALFLDEARAHVGSAIVLARRIGTPGSGDVARELSLHAHSLRGLASTLGLAELARVTHTAEDLVARIRSGVPAAKGGLLDVLREIETLVDAVEADPANAAGDRAADPTELSALVARLRAVVQSAAADLDKRVDLDLVGAEVRIERAALAAIAVPLIHVLRNAVDHGIESLDERRALGKPDSGTIRITVEATASHVLFAVEDDGRGIDPEAVRRRAVEQGLLTAAEARALDPDEARMVVTFPGFTTRDRPDAMSGRGVGLDAVRTDVESVGGDVTLRSAPGRWTRVELRLPLSGHAASRSWPTPL